MEKKDASLEFVNCVTKNIENKEQFKTELSALKKSEEYEVAVQERNRIIAATNACSNQIKKARQVETEYGPNSMEHIYAAKKMYDCTTTSANIESLSESWNAFKECYKPEGEFFNGLEHRYVANQCRPAFLSTYYFIGFFIFIIFSFFLFFLFFFFVFFFFFLFFFFWLFCFFSIYWIY